MGLTAPSVVTHLLLALLLVERGLAQQCGTQGGNQLCASPNCCSQFGYCGVGTAYCGTGCQSGPCTSASGQCSVSSPCSGSNCCSQFGYCGTGTDYCGTGCQGGPCTGGTGGGSGCGSGVGGVVSQSQFNSIFPNRNSFFTYSAFTTAAASFSGFGTQGDCNTRKQEIAAFFAHVSHETSGLLKITEDDTSNVYCDNSVYPCASGKKYYGRGPLQLSWNYNYKQCGDAIGEDLLNNPDLVATNAVVSFKASIWFWQTAQSPKPSCHSVITGTWSPSASDVAQGRLAGFGMSINIINGGLECGTGSNSAQAQSRINLYQSVCSTFGVSGGSNLSCANMTPYG